ncbi:hypothetical protein Q8A67_024533 [Cirrhinus molitorella]|uniref:Uncharacterized protein n=1 Tax=Cirrhinus molitorella TaxID=172907 RepID=A0AA88NYN6_9TELE|nr:hypothetical protein Q8A67_024533 [Cirrhinus molitorella]
MEVTEAVPGRSLSTPVKTVFVRELKPVAVSVVMDEFGDMCAPSGCSHLSPAPLAHTHSFFGSRHLRPLRYRLEGAQYPKSLLAATMQPVSILSSPLLSSPLFCSPHARLSPQQMAVPPSPSLHPTAPGPAPRCPLRAPSYRAGVAHATLTAPTGTFSILLEHRQHQDPELKGD